jgi:hypothetical protein
MTNVPEDFIRRWSRAGGSEKANYQLFLTELCELLNLPKTGSGGRMTKLDDPA